MNAWSLLLVIASMVLLAIGELGLYKQMDIGRAAAATTSAIFLVAGISVHAIVSAIRKGPTP